MRKSYSCFDFHSSDNISEHNVIIETLSKNEKKDFLKYINWILLNLNKGYLK